MTSLSLDGYQSLKRGLEWIYRTPGMKKKTKGQKEARFQVKERAYRDQIAKLQKLVYEQNRALQQQHELMYKKEWVRFQLDYLDGLTAQPGLSETSKLQEQ